MVGSGPGFSFHFPDRDPVMERSAKRFRITGKSSAVRRARVTPKRWKRLVPQGTMLPGIQEDLPPFLFPRTGGWLMSLSDIRDLSLQGKVSDAFSPLQHFVLLFN